MIIVFIDNQITKKKLIYQGKWQKNICDNPPPGSYLYSVIARYDSGTKLFTGDEIYLPRVIISDNFVPPLPDIVTKDWDKQWCSIQSERILENK